MNSNKLLESAHLKKTKSRIKVLDAFIFAERPSFSVEDLTLLSRVSLRCVYNVIADLLRTEIIKKVTVKNDRAAYYSLNK